MKLAQNLNNLGTESAFSVLAEAKALEAKGHPMIHLGLGQPDFKTPKHVVEAAKKALDDGHHGYVMSNGIPECREAVTRWIKKRYDADIDAERILIMPGGKPTMSYAIQCFGEPGAEIIHPTPAFPIYESMINYTGSTPVPYDLTEDKDLKFDPDKILSLITDKTRLLILINPNNPTGSFVEKPVIDYFAKELEKHPHVTILSDEIYSRQIFDYKEMPSFFHYEALKDRLIVLEGWSKAYSMTGWRLGYLIVPEAWIGTAAKLHQNLMISANEFVQEAGLKVLQESRETCEAMKDEFDRRRKFLLEKLKEFDLDPQYQPNSAFYVFLRYRDQKRSSLELAIEILEKTGVALTPGVDFGPGGEGFLRFSYANSQENLERALKRIKESGLI